MARTQGSHSQITGPRIHAVAQSLFAKHGFAAVSMRQIAGEVGVQVGALYNYIPDKQALLFSLLEGHMVELLAAWRGIAAAKDASANPAGVASGAQGAALARLEAFVRFHIGFHLDRPEAVFIAYMELRNLSPENFAVIEGLRGEYEDALEAILRDGAAQGDFALGDSKLTTLAVIAMLTGVTTWYRTSGRLSSEEVQDHYWQMVRKAVVA